MDYWMIVGISGQINSFKTLPSVRTKQTMGESLKKKRNRKFEFEVKLWWLVGEKKFLGFFRSNEGLEG